MRQDDDTDMEPRDGEENDDFSEGPQRKATSKNQIGNPGARRQAQD